MPAFMTSSSHTCPKESLTVECVESGTTGGGGGCIPTDTHSESSFSSSQKARSPRRAPQGLVNSKGGLEGRQRSIHFTVLQMLSSELSCSLRARRFSSTHACKMFWGLKTTNPVECHESPLVNHLSGTRQAEFLSSQPSWGSLARTKQHTFGFQDSKTNPCPRSALPA